jgi:hypothetical protein
MTTKLATHHAGVPKRNIVAVTAARSKVLPGRIAMRVPMARPATTLSAVAATKSTSVDGIASTTRSITRSDPYRPAVWDDREVPRSNLSSRTNLAATRTMNGRSRLYERSMAASMSRRFARICSSSRPSRSAASMAALTFMVMSA